ncbi:fucolectin-like [Ruditapes philippinarum]|uniref:fucolectin-like n=1 Tax=Ruditapes philippinarum TaxID=129788 RepID=UPI00295B4DAD|nr:fucolectin-like [Ruditapes philippinarum]
MHFFSSGSVLMVSGFFIACVVVLNSIADGIKFVEYKTGFNPNLNLYILQATSGISRITCGALCDEKECKSFIYDESANQCTVYSVFMTDDIAVAIGRYYIRSDEVKDTCSNEPLLNTGPNIALHKPVTLSSEFDGSQPSPGNLMVDGSRSGIFPCAHTVRETDPYAIVDLLQTFQISSMYIVNRSDCCGERLRQLVIKVGDNLTRLKPVFNHTAVIGATCTILFDEQHQGRYVKLYIEGLSSLAVCELEVYSSG